MKTTIALFTLALTVFATAPLKAADAPAQTLETSASVFDHIKVKYWGNYAGPQLARPTSKYTTDPFGKLTARNQNADDLLTAGYQVTPGLRPGIGMPFNFVPMTSSVIQIKPLYFGLIDMKLFESGNLKIHGDARLYTPIGDVAATQDVKTGVRFSQIALYRVGDTNLTLGSYTYIRYWVYGKNGTGFRNDFEVYFSPFANYRLTRSLYATLWTDVLQLGHQYGTPSGLKNLPVDIQPGIRWDITESFSINPYLNFIPAALRLDTVNVGLVVNATLL